MLQNKNTHISEAVKYTDLPALLDRYLTLNYQISHILFAFVEKKEV